MNVRESLYQNGGANHMMGLVDQVFADPSVRELRERWVKYARSKGRQLT